MARVLVHAGAATSELLVKELHAFGYDHMVVEDDLTACLAMEEGTFSACVTLGSDDVTVAAQGAGVPILDLGGSDDVAARLRGFLVATAA